MIYYPKIYGTCAGANKAIEVAYKLKKENTNKNIYIYKEILHNPYIIKELEKDDIKCIDDLSLLTKNDILIIRAHGEPKETYDYLEKNNIEYYDATCTNVLKVHNIAIDKQNNGYKIIIVGKKTHPEVIGTNGWINNEGIIIEKKDDYKELNKNDKYFIVCQTTVSHKILQELLNYMNENNISYEIENTICNAQKLIQTSSITLAEQMDIMFVIGGKESSNTKELFNLCNEVTKTYYFSDIKEFFNFIKKEKYTLNTKIGFTGGASTPKDQIKEYANLLEFFIYYKSKLKEFEVELKKINKTFIEKDNPIVIDAINKFINMNGDGKFLRGCLIDLGYKLNKNDDYAKTLSLAYETFETSILIHDDIIDNAHLRRNKETIHETYKNEFKKYNVENDNTNNSLALCIGDLGFFYTTELITKKYKNDKNLAKLLSYYNNIVIKTIKGEIIDVALPFIEKNDKKHTLHEEDIMEIYKLKTSWYTIVGPFVLGMILGNSKVKDMEIFEKVLEPLGIAFQIKDDILGIYSSKEILGKSVYSDIEEFKQTILYSYIKIKRNDLLDELLKYYGRSINEEESKKVQQLFEESGALEYATNKMNGMFNEAYSNIKSMDIKEYIKNILLGLILFLRLREK
ncbi:MAG: 4-hydroxy-3-methylbut-2-enyl diphosphate reductase [Mollicutes bacterium]|nr:4-hydroxy-3-methylbut-2-enyl diphosphate reductase [Mollicutes bacterium]